MLLLLVYLSNLLFPVPYVPAVSLFTAAAAAVASYRKGKKRRGREFPLRFLFTLWIKRKEFVREFKRSSLPHKLQCFMRQLVELSAVHSGKHHWGQATLEWPAERPIPDLNRFPSRTHPIPYAVRKTKQSAAIRRKTTPWKPMKQKAQPARAKINEPPGFVRFVCAESYFPFREAELRGI